MYGRPSFQSSADPRCEAPAKGRPCRPVGCPNVRFFLRSRPNQTNPRTIIASLPGSQVLENRLHNGTMYV